MAFFAGWDHMDILGDSLEAIAFEKAGIFTKFCTVALGEERARHSRLCQPLADDEKRPSWWKHKRLLRAGGMWFSAFPQDLLQRRAMPFGSEPGDCGVLSLSSNTNLAERTLTTRTRVWQSGASPASPVCCIRPCLFFLRESAAAEATPECVWIFRLVATEVLSLGLPPARLESALSTRLGLRGQQLSESQALKAARALGFAGEDLSLPLAVVLDVAHNQSALDRLLQVLDEFRENSRLHAAELERERVSV